MTPFTKKELNILYAAMSRWVVTQQRTVESMDHVKCPDVYTAEVRALKDMQDLQEKLDEVIFSQNKFPEIVD